MIIADHYGETFILYKEKKKKGKEQFSSLNIRLHISLRNIQNKLSEKRQMNLPWNDNFSTTVASTERLAVINRTW